MAHHYASNLLDNAALQGASPSMYSLCYRFDFCMAPANIRDPRMAAALLHFAARYAHGLPATLDIALPDTPPSTAEELRHVEATHQVCLVVESVHAQS